MLSLDLDSVLGTLAIELPGRRRRLERIAFRWCGNRALAEDLVQEMFTKAIRNLHQLRDLRCLDAWLCNILRNCYIDHRRREPVTENIDCLSDDPRLAADFAPEQSDVIARVRTAVSNLPESQRTVLSMVDLEGFSYTEVATALGIPIGTVTSRISRAREALRVELRDLVADLPDNVVYLDEAKR